MTFVSLLGGIEFCLHRITLTMASTHLACVCVGYSCVSTYQCLFVYSRSGVDQAQHVGVSKQLKLVLMDGLCCKGLSLAFCLHGSDVDPVRTPLAI